MLKNRSNNAHVIAISSGKGGVGKSNIAANLSISMANAGFKICLFDADINLANINILLGFNPPHTLQHLFTENKRIENIIYHDSTGIDIIAGASGVAEFIRLSAQQQQTLLSALKQLQQNYDYLIIDTAAGIDNGVLSFLHSVPYLIITLTKEPTSLTDAFSLLKVLKKQDYNHTILVVINMVSGLKMAKHIFFRFNEAVNKYLHLDSRLLGYIVTDDNVSLAVEKQKPFIKYFPESPASICINNISRHLLKTLEQNKTSEPVFTDFFESLIENSNSPINRDELMEEILHLADEDMHKLFEKLKIHLKGKQQHVIIEPAKILTSRLKNIPLKNKELQFINTGLKQAQQLASRLGK